MTIKRFVLTILTLFAFMLMVTSLGESWDQPQIQSRLELHQTDLLLQASEWQGQELAGQAALARQVLLSADPLATVTEEYEELRQGLVTQKTKVTEPLYQRQLEEQLAELDLRLGILKAQRGQTQPALEIWQTLATEDFEDRSQQWVQLAQVAKLLTQLWDDPPALVTPEAEQQLKTHLDGWFRYRAMAQLYQVQGGDDRRQTLLQTEQQTAKQAFLKLLLIGAMPGLGLILGTLLILLGLGQWWWQGKQSLIARHGSLVWESPWTLETVWQVFILGFFLMGQFIVPQFLLPLSFQVLDLHPATFNERTRAMLILVSYGLVALSGVGTLVWSLRSFRPLPPGWFTVQWQGSWFLWGLGGYLVAIPLVVLVSLVNQLLWQGQGGSNPILPIALGGQDRVAIACFVFTASIAAPLFEELMFRGFLLPSLTRYVSVTGAIVISSLIFAIVHLNLSEILPLTTLGMVLGFVYTRSRNLLAPMLLHSLWNGGTLLSLFILGSS